MAALFVRRCQVCFSLTDPFSCSSGRLLTHIWRFSMQRLISTHLEGALLYFSNQKIKITVQNGARGNTFNLPSDYFSASPKSEIFNFSKSREVKRCNRSAFYFPARNVNNSAVQEIICETHLWLVFLRSLSANYQALNINSCCLLTFQADMFKSFDTGGSSYKHCGRGVLEIHSGNKSYI